MSFIPEQGDIILIDFNPQAGHDQKGEILVYVISNYIFNQFTKMAIVCPIANTNKGFPLHVPLEQRTKTTGVIMCEQAKSLDIIARRSSFLEKSPQDILDEVLDIFIGFVE